MPTTLGVLKGTVFFICGVGALLLLSWVGHMFFVYIVIPVLAIIDGTL